MRSARTKPIPTRPATRRCAIYTRKSSEEGLEQEFNSLDAQRDACEAYARSQRHEGWTVLPAHYDDGGISGGTLERPALQRLLAEIGAGKIDLVLVYKVDRLTRSLADFAKIVEVLDASGASFVSVTQHFNTATSMGRLTLNMLLSFAQFEREVAGERIRDKIAASKRKGMWMGGTIPLGYAVHNRKLVVNEAEAERVRHIFRRYVDLGSVRLLQAHLATEGVLGKTGAPLGRGALFHLLQNQTYRGKVAHKGQIYPGEQPAIVDDALWQAVHRRLAENQVARAASSGAAHPSLLAGLLYGPDGEPMTATHAVKGSRRYRYYVSRGLITRTRETNPDSLRVPAAEIERLVVNRLQQFLADPASVLDGLREADVLPPGAAEQQQIFQRAALLGERWPAFSGHVQRSVLTALLSRVDMTRERIALHLSANGLRALMDRPDPVPVTDAEAAPGPTTLTLSIPTVLRRAGKEMALLVGAAETPATADRSLVQLLARAQKLREALRRRDAGSLTAIARREGMSASYASRLIRLAWMAPDIVAAILNGSHPADLTATRLMEDTRLPLAWQAQRGALGFA